MRITQRLRWLIGILMCGVIAGCQGRGTPANMGTDAAGSETASPSETPLAAPDRVIDHNDLFFTDVSPQTGEPLELSANALRGRWVAFRSPAGSGENLVTASVFSLNFGTGGELAYSLNEQGELVDNPDGYLFVLIDGYELGMQKSAMAWGLNKDQDQGWVASPFEADGAPFAKSLEFELVRSDLLHVTGQIVMGNGMLVGVDMLLLPVNVDYYQEPPPPIEFTADETVPVPQANDPLVESESVAPFIGTWIIESPGRKTTLVIGDHRVLRMSQQRDGLSLVEDHLLQYNPVEKCLEIQMQTIASETLGPIDEHGLSPKSASLTLTSGGRLVYQANPNAGIVFTREVDADP